MLQSLKPPISRRTFWREVIIAVVVAAAAIRLLIAYTLADPSGSCACPRAPIPSSRPAH